MMYPHPIIAKEGWLYLVVIGVLAFVVHRYAGFFRSWPLWLFFIFTLQFFRDPQRIAPLGKDLVLSPVDGRIVVVEKAHDPYANRDALKISVFMNVFNVHSNRSAVNGLIKQVTYFPGKFFNASIDKASTENERNAVVIRDPQGRLVTAVQIAGLIARRILCYVQPGDELDRASRYGFIRFGSRVDVYLPIEARPQVTVGQIVKATSTVLARLEPQGA